MGEAEYFGEAIFAHTRVIKLELVPIREVLPRFFIVRALLLVLLYLTCSLFNIFIMCSARYVAYMSRYNFSRSRVPTLVN